MNSVILENNQYAICEINSDKNLNEFTGVLTYKGFENGVITGPSMEAVTNQYNLICSMIDNDGAMLRRGTIMLGYHNDVLKGDVLLVDGEIIGRWEMEEDDDWSHFFSEAKPETKLSAPSAWLLQDAIADWLEK